MIGDVGSSSRDLRLRESIRFAAEPAAQLVRGGGAA
jgi:hypothetical protein